MKHTWSPTNLQGSEYKKISRTLTAAGIKGKLYELYLRKRLSNHLVEEVHPIRRRHDLHKCRVTKFKSFPWVQAIRFGVRMSQRGSRSSLKTHIKCRKISTHIMHWEISYSHIQQQRTRWTSESEQNSRDSKRRTSMRIPKDQPLELFKETIQKLKVAYFAIVNM